VKDKSLWSRCSLGRSRWYWIVYHTWEDMFNEADPIATGYAASPEECESAALAIEPTAVLYQTYFAAGHHRKLCVHRRMQKTSDSKEAVQQQYLYTDREKGDWWDGTGDWLYSQPHRVVKTTKHSVFVERDCWRPEGAWRGYDVKKYRLDRAELTATGEVWSRQARDRFYTTPVEERRQPHRPQYLVDLDLPQGATKAQITSQFRRLAKVHHPDCDGDAEDFRRIMAAYEQALIDVKA
jgi:DnaJ domain